jgi:hypothetical protein
VKEEKMKNIIRIFIPLIALLFLISCSATESELIENGYTVGTVVKGGVEGPVFGIRTDSGENLDPINLPDEFKTYGKRIALKYVVRDDMASVHMWGTIIEIKETKEL